MVKPTASYPATYNPDPGPGGFAYMPVWIQYMPVVGLLKDHEARATAAASTCSARRITESSQSTRE